MPVHSRVGCRSCVQTLAGRLEKIRLFLQCREATWLLRRLSHDEWTSEEFARGCDGDGLPRLLHADLGWPHQELLQQLLLPGCRFARLPDELRRMPRHLLLRVQHEVLHLHMLLPLQSAELLQEVRVLQQHLLPAMQLVLLQIQLLLLRQLRPLLLHLLRDDRSGLAHGLPKVHLTPSESISRNCSAAASDDRQTPRIEGGARIRGSLTDQARPLLITRSFKRVVRPAAALGDDGSHLSSLAPWLASPVFCCFRCVTAITVITHQIAVRRI